MKHKNGGIVPNKKLKGAGNFIETKCFLCESQLKEPIAINLGERVICSDCSDANNS